MRSLLAEKTSPQEMSQKDEIIVALAVLLFALICILALVVGSRCAWICRLCDRIFHRGLKKKVLGSLPVFAFLEAEHAGKFIDCAICLTDFSAGDMIRLMPQCGHGYHVECIDTWLRSHKSCPSCRQILVTVRCDKCGAKDPPPARSVPRSELQRMVTSHVNMPFP